MNELPLNCADKNMLACERENFSFNSHIVMDLQTPLDEERLKETVEEFFLKIPITRTIIKNERRLVLDKPNMSGVLKIVPVTQEIEEDFYARPFYLEQEHPVRFLYGKPEKSDGTWRFVLSVHHSSFDGVAHTYLFREFLKIYKREEISPWARDFSYFRFRDIFLKYLSPMKALTLLGQTLIKVLIHPKKKSNTLLSEPGNTKRRCRIDMIEVPAVALERLTKEGKSLGLNYFERVSVSIGRALKTSIRNQSNKPYVLIVPVNLRSALRIDKFFQNVNGFIRLNFYKDEIESTAFPAILKERLKRRSHLSFVLIPLFTAGLFATLVGLKKLSRKVQELDEDPEFIYGSAIITAIRLPLSLDLSSFNVKRIYGHGNMFKSPGLGIVLTGSREKPIIVIEYLEDLIKETDIERFKNALLSDLGITA